ncbi:hypothetical protein D3C75_1192900 [compost metagenome]
MSWLLARKASSIRYSFPLGKVIKMKKPIRNSGIMAKMLKLASPVIVVVSDITAGPRIAANLPKIL